MASPTAADDNPNKSAKKPAKELEMTATKELVIDGKRAQEEVKAQLKMKNASKNKIAYKVMCNHPFVIALEKEIGFIEPGATATVEIRRLKFDSGRYDRQGRRTMLLVQHVNVSPAAENVRKIWANVFGSVAMKKRIQVKFQGDGDRILGEGAGEEDDATEAE